MGMLLKKTDPDRVAAALSREPAAIIDILNKIYGENGKGWTIQGVESYQARAVAAYCQLTRPFALSEFEAIEILKKWSPLSPDPGLALLIYPGGLGLECDIISTIGAGPEHILERAARAVTENRDGAPCSRMFTIVDMRLIAEAVDIKLRGIDFY